MIDRSSTNATHHLVCQHVCRWTKTYLMKCHVLKTMPDGRLKVLVFGDRNCKDRDHLSRIRYVEADRIRPIQSIDENTAPEPSSV